MTNLFILILQFLFSLLGYFAWVRFLLQWAQSPVYNIFTKQIIQFCKPILKPFQYIIGSYKQYNLTVLLFLIVLNVLDIVILVGLTYHTFPNIGGLLLLSLIKMLLQLCSIIFYGTIIYALMSWFPSLTQSPLGQCIIAIIDPMVGYFRRFIPNMGVFDFSPMALMVAILIIQYLLSILLTYAMTLALM
jgi:YggT family protein